jgi:plastocyanin
MIRLFRLSLAAAAALALVGIGPGQAAAPQTLIGTVGPGFTITLKFSNGKAVRTVKAGTYRVRISDKASIHNFHLRGPGVNKSTGVGFTGTTTITVKLRKGTYRYVCDPHASSLKGSFRVT